MNCNIILRVEGLLPEIIFTSNNFNETLHQFENLALDEVTRLGGEISRKITTNKNKIRERGFYCVSEFNRFMIYKKEKNGWLYSGALRLLKEFELIYYKINRNNKDQPEITPILIKSEMGDVCFDFEGDGVNDMSFGETVHIRETAYKQLKEDEPIKSLKKTNYIKIDGYNLPEHIDK